MTETNNWITWAGGDCPVPADARVAIKFRCGEEDDRHSAEVWRWWHVGDTDRAYGDPNEAYDIVSYQVLTAQTA